MADIVNLNRARKKKRAAQKDKTAEQNLLKFGRTKAEKERTTAERLLNERRADAGRLDEQE